MKYPYKVNILKSGKWSTMSFSLPENIKMVEVFLFCDAQGDGSDFIEEIDKVLSGKMEYNETHGNQCGLEIRKDYTKVKNILAEDGENESCYIETSELKELILAWDKERRTFREEYGKNIRL